MEEIEKCRGIKKLSNNPFLNLYQIDARTSTGKSFDYYFASRNSEDHIKIKTKALQPEGIVIYPVMEKDPGKIVMIRQYRYPMDAYIYEFPAGIIDPGETTEETAIREMKEETGLDFTVYQGGKDCFRRPFFMGPGFTDESDAAVFGYASGDISVNGKEDSETIEVLLVDRMEAERILREERVCIRAAYLLMQFLRMEETDPFAFLQ